MPFSENSAYCLKKRIDEVEIPWLPWITHPGHPDFGSKAGADAREEHVYSALSSGWDFELMRMKRSLAYYVTPENLVEHPDLYLELDRSRAARHIGVWYKVWEWHQEAVNEWREDMENAIDTYIGTDMVEDGDKIYDADNPMMADIIFQRALDATPPPMARYTGARYDFPYLARIPEHIREMARVNAENRALMDAVREHHVEAEKELAEARRKFDELPGTLLWAAVAVIGSLILVGIIFGGS